MIRDAFQKGDVPNYVEAFREPVLEMVKSEEDGRNIHSCVKYILRQCPRVNAKVRNEIYAEVAKALIPNRSSNKEATSWMSDDQVEAYLTSRGA